MWKTGNFKNITGQVFNKLTVVSRADVDKNGQACWNCVCECGNKVIVPGHDLRSGRKKSCGCDKKPCNFIDLTGMIFGKWTVVKYDKNSHWICQCVCGVEKSVAGKTLRAGKSKSCGRCKGRVEPGQIYGDLTVIERVIDENNCSKWLCRCKCGNIKEYLAGNLLSGQTISCGKHQWWKYDIVGNKYGMLTVESFAYVDDNSRTYWNCLCDCGNHCAVQRGSLTRGLTRSCGCMRSFGEQVIKKELERMQIDFIHGKRIPELKSSNGGSLEFDFDLYQNGKRIFLLEYQGEQHYVDKGLFGKQQREETDAIKRDWCRQNNIPLEEIRYDEPIIPRLHEILSSYKLIPCQAPLNGEGVTTIPDGSTRVVELHRGSATPLLGNAG